MLYRRLLFILEIRDFMNVGMMPCVATVRFRGKPTSKQSIRLIEPRDGKAMGQVIIQVLSEWQCDSVYFSKPQLLDNLAEDYQKPGAKYWVVTDKATGKILGGAGYGQLEGTRAEYKT